VRVRPGALWRARCGREREREEKGPSGECFSSPRARELWLRQSEWDSVIGRLGMGRRLDRWVCG
jgi:hypothetical protein